MTRIVIDPAALRTAAQFFRVGAAEYEVTAGTLRGGALPAMPFTVLLLVEDAIASTATSLDALAGDLRQKADELDARAAVAELAASGGAATSPGWSPGQSTTAGGFGPFAVDHAAIDELITRTQGMIDVQSAGLSLEQALGTGAGGLEMAGTAGLALAVGGAAASIWGGVDGQVALMATELGGLSVDALREQFGLVAEATPLGQALGILRVGSDLERVWNDWPEDPSSADIEQWMHFGADAFDAAGDAAFMVSPPVGLVFKGVAFGANAGMWLYDHYGDQMETWTHEAVSILGGLFAGPVQ